MKNIVLLGDSIRMSYQPFVRELMGESAYVWGPFENCQHTVNVLLNLWQWIAPLRADVIHVNAGIWDTRRIIPGGECIVPLAYYKKNVELILTSLKAVTSAKIIWATSTPVLDDKVRVQQLKNGSAGRRAIDIVRYNKAAVDVALKLNVPVNPLYDVVMKNGLDTMLTDDGTHFTDAGARILAQAVVNAVQ